MAGDDGTMRHGVTIFVTDMSIGVAELAREVEARGFDSMWVPEHTHIPLSRRTPWPPAPDRPIAEEYKRCLDPLVALTAAAAATERLRLGTGVMLVAQRDPIVTAKAIATLDVISGGRLSLGIGFGWNEDEMEHHGVEYRTRRARGREHVLAMQAMWRDDEASFEGSHVHFSPSWSWPKPLQRPLPVLIGGAPGPLLFNHIAEYAHGWIPIGGRGLTESLPKLREAVAEAGRDPAGLEIVPVAVIPDAGKLEHYERIGVTECVFQLPSADRDTVLRVLDRHAQLVTAQA
jgi:probable F420-dependent oxidoreductase